MSRSGLTGAAALVTALALGQKLMAFAREQAIARAFGATGITDAYLVGVMIPELAWIVAAAGITNALVPAFSQLVAAGDAQGARRAAGAAIRWTAVVAVPLVALLYLALPAVLALLAPNMSTWSPDRVQLALTSARLALPAVALAAMAAPLRALLHAHSVFHYTPLVVLVQNLWVAMLALSLANLGPLVLAGGQLTGIALHLAVFGFALWRQRQVPEAGAWREAGLRPALPLILPLVVWALPMQLYVVVDRSLGSALSAGTVAALAFADKLRQLPLQTAMYAVTTVAYPGLAAAAASGDGKRLQAVLGQALRMVAIVGLPVMVGLAVLSRPIVELVYQRGAFDAEATALTARVLVVFALGVLPIGIGMLLAHTHFSLGRPWVPVLALLSGEAVHLIFGQWLGPMWGVSGIAWASLLGVTLAAGLQIVSLRRILWQQPLGLFRQMQVPLVATLVTTLVALAVLPLLGRLPAGFRQAGTLAAVVVAALAYSLVLWRGKVAEVEAVVAMVRRRFGGP